MQGVGTGIGHSHSDTSAFRPVTSLTQELNISCGATAAFHHGYDVIEFQPLLAATLNTLALIPPPHEHLNSSRNALTFLFGRGCFARREAVPSR